jgi:hypothetical protein
MTKQQEYLAEFKAITEQMYAITEAKNSDYTGDTSDPFKNFKAVEMLGVTTVEVGFFTRMTDKMMRLGGFIKNGTLKVADEKIEDTLMDLAVYSILMICYLRSKRISPNERTVDRENTD